ncbi:ABC transporter permease [Nocardioides piscis]|uniref:ABC transporter permease n=1 Tax=Nocardioides piscis TaxID=2714938 RepID=A0A6G7YHM3_9ACTN|nr:hypothetical protein [Nocardioides piscis]QIK76117.1 hypothetical protein G7071_12440 [Nocardioides piscis]
MSYLMSGRQAAIDTIGGIVANEISQVAQLGICLMVMFLVVRHTRAEEESGRAELVRSVVVGRHAATLAGLLYGVGAALLIAVVTSVSMLAAGLDRVGSVTYGAGLALLGLCFVGVSLVAAQLSTSARGALGITGAVVALSYVVRGLGAMQDNALVWASPFGWAQEMDAFGVERWWPALLLVVTTAALLALAAWLTVQRDFGSGVLHARPGPPRSTALLGTPVGLVLRLQRNLIVGWAVGLTALGMLYGAVIPTIPELVASNPDIAAAIGASPDAEQTLIDAFLRYVFLFMAVISSCFVVASVLRLRAEEESGRADAILATRVTRTAWAGATILVTGLGALLLTVLMGLGLAIGYGLGMGEWDQVAEHVGGQLSYLPGSLVLAALALALVGLWPRHCGAAWAAVAFVFFQAMLGETLRLPAWVDGISPFWHLSQVPLETLDAVPTLVELTLATALVLLGVWGYRRRDVAAS